VPPLGQVQGIFELIASTAPKAVRNKKIAKAKIGKLIIFIVFVCMDYKKLKT